MITHKISAQEQQLYNELRQAISNPDGSLLNLGQLLWYAAQKFPDKLALICQDQTVTYKELFFRASLFSKKLKSQGIKPRDRVLLFFENSIEFYIGYYAIVQLGAVVAPLNIFLKERELEHIINDAQPTLLVASTVLIKKLVEDHIDAKVPVLTQEDMDLASAVDLKMVDGVQAHLLPDQMAALLYTSGTTGLPKGVMLSSKNILTNCMQTIARLGLVSDERVFGGIAAFS